MTDNSSWKEIAQRKCAFRDSLIPPEWRIPAAFLPREPPLPTYGPQNDLQMPSECGMLTQSEISITETYPVSSLLDASSNKALSAIEVTTAFCKRTAMSQKLTNCITEPLFSNAI
jgi:hypothetical protein